MTDAIDKINFKALNPLLTRSSPLNLPSMEANNARTEPVLAQPSVPFFTMELLSDLSSDHQRLFGEALLRVIGVEGSPDAKRQQVAKILMEADGLGKIPAEVCEAVGIEHLATMNGDLIRIVVGLPIAILRAAGGEYLKSLDKIGLVALGTLAIGTVRTRAAAERARREEERQRIIQRDLRDKEEREVAIEKLPAVCREGTDLSDIGIGDLRDMGTLSGEQVQAIGPSSLLRRNANRGLLLGNGRIHLLATIQAKKLAAIGGEALAILPHKETQGLKGMSLEKCKELGFLLRAKLAAAGPGYLEKAHDRELLYSFTVEEITAIGGGFLAAIQTRRLYSEQVSELIAALHACTAEQLEGLKEVLDADGRLNLGEDGLIYAKDLQKFVGKEGGVNKRKGLKSPPAAIGQEIPGLPKSLLSIMAPDQIESCSYLDREQIEAVGGEWLCRMDARLIRVLQVLSAKQLKAIGGENLCNQKNRLELLTGRFRELTPRQIDILKERGVLSAEEGDYLEGEIFRGLLRTLRAEDNSEKTRGVEGEMRKIVAANEPKTIENLCQLLLQKKMVNEAEVKTVGASVTQLMQLLVSKGILFGKVEEDTLIPVLRLIELLRRFGKITRSEEVDVSNELMQKLTLAVGRYNETTSFMHHGGGEKESRFKRLTSAQLQVLLDEKLMEAELGVLSPEQLGALDELYYPYSSLHEKEGIKNFSFFEPEKIRYMGESYLIELWERHIPLLVQIPMERLKEMGGILGGAKALRQLDAPRLASFAEMPPERFKKMAKTLGGIDGLCRLESLQVPYDQVGGYLLDGLAEAVEASDFDERLAFAKAFVKTTWGPRSK